MNISIILSGGEGKRFASATPKQYQTLMGKEVISYSIRAMRGSELSDGILVVSDSKSVERLAAEYYVPCIVGGSTRNESLRNALEYVRLYIKECKKVFINEAARPFLTAQIIDSYFRYLNEYDAVITAQHITDSLGREGEAVTDRDEYYLVQAPEAFRFDLLYRHFLADSPITATVQQLPADRKVYKCFDFKHNLKITYKEDLLHAEQIMRLLYGDVADER